MEIVFSLALSVITTVYLRLLIIKSNKTKRKPIPRQSQSKNVLDFNKRIEGILQQPEKPKTQSTNYIAKTSIKAIVMDDQAYWITNNAFYTANIVDGIIEENSTRLVDTMTMDKVQLDKMMFIVDKLREEG